MHPSSELVLARASRCGRADRRPAPSQDDHAVEAAFTADWPSGTKGYTVQVQTLPVAGTTVAAVAAAKTAALGKGAGSVGALKPSEYSSLGGENYVVYSGVYHKRGEAEKALARCIPRRERSEASEWRGPSSPRPRPAPGRGILSSFLIRT